MKVLPDFLIEILFIKTIIINKQRDKILVMKKRDKNVSLNGNDTYANIVNNLKTKSNNLISIQFIINRTNSNAWRATFEYEKEPWETCSWNWEVSLRYP